MKTTYITIHTDGACLNNPGVGGWAAIICINTDGKVVAKTCTSGACPETTNNRMEMNAALQGLLQITPGEDQPITVYSDSQLLIRGMTEWSPKWIAADWRKADGKPVQNRDLWEALHAVCARLNVSWQWVKGHNGDPRNEEADRLAGRAARQACSSSRFAA
ncbi:ribonuclease HI [Jannaschia sp. 2305UL9-9]|uniref:ribonuclease HI n=1 Tax=Jannaschia sp. 2305UL9-9 TaxID=3121638 RepID=UPI003527C510